MSDEQDKALAAETERRYRDGEMELRSYDEYRAGRAVKDDRRWTLHVYASSAHTETDCHLRDSCSAAEIVVVPLSALEAAKAEADRWSAEANDRGLRLEAAERARDEAEEHIRQFHSAAAKTRIEKLERNASELELLRQAATEWEDCTQSYIARIEKLEAVVAAANKVSRKLEAALKAIDREPCSGSREDYCGCCQFAMRTARAALYEEGKP